MSSLTIVEVYAGAFCIFSILWLGILCLGDMTRLGKYTKRYYIERVDRWDVNRGEYIPEVYHLRENNILIPFIVDTVTSSNCDKDGHCPGLKNLISKRDKLKYQRKDRKVKMKDKDLVFEEI